MSEQYTLPEERDFIDSWACRHVEYEIPSDERADVARDFLARVRREAAREALDGYADAEEDSFLALHVKGAPISAAQCTHAAMTAREYRDRNFSEKED